MYDEGRRSIGGIPTHSVIDFNDDTIKCFFVDEADDAPDQTNDQDAADRTAAAQVPDYASAVDTAMVASITGNVLMLDGTDAVFTALNDDPVESYDIFKDSAVEATSPLIANFDDATGLPLDPSGGNVTIVWAATGIIRV